MIVWSGLVLSFVVSMTSGARKYYETMRTLDDSSIEYINNIGFPEPAPPLTTQTWTYKYTEKPGVEEGINVVCGFSMAMDMKEKKCIDKVIFEDGRHKFPVCQQEYFYYTTFTNELSITLSTAHNGGSLLSCSLKVVKTKREEYLKQVSEEIDSSEFGGEEGEIGTSCPCGWANKVKSRIVNGTETAPGEFPFMALVFNNHQDGIWCGGTIITKYHVLTAAHCTYGMEAKDLRVTVGAHDVDSGYAIAVERIGQHSKYDNDTLKNDLTLLTLKSEIPFNQFAGPACLPLASEQLNLDGKYLTSMGWGRLAHEGWTSRYLMKVHVKVMPILQCHHMYYFVDHVNPTQICDFATAKSSCQGDSGGPVVWLDPETNRYTLVGATSFGKTCADYHPNVNTRVQAYVDWIQEEITKSGKPNSQTCSKLY